MGLYFFVGVIIYLLILVILMVWFLKYHNNNDRSGSKPLKGNPDYNDGDKKDDSPVKPNQMSVELIQTGVQSGSEKSEVLPGYCSQPKF